MKTSEVLACLDHVPIFDSLTTAEKKEIALIAKHEKYNKNNFIYHAGDTLDALYVVHEGSVKIIKYTADGKEQIIRVLKHGDFFGETALFGEESINNYAEILEDAVICKVERSSFLKIIIKMSTIAKKMLKELSLRLNKLEETLMFANLKTADSKVAKYLLEQSREGMVNLKITKKTISGQLGITAETLSRKISHFHDKKYIEIISNKIIKIKDEDRLIEIVEG